MTITDIDALEMISSIVPVWWEKYITCAPVHSFPIPVQYHYVGKLKSEKSPNRTIQNFSGEIQLLRIYQHPAGKVGGFG